MNEPFEYIVIKIAWMKDGFSLGGILYPTKSRFESIREVREPQYFFSFERRSIATRKISRKPLSSTIGNANGTNPSFEHIMKRAS